MVFDQTGALASVSRHDYLPFGEELFAGTSGRTTAQGYTASDNVRQKFTSYERDNESGLDYAQARYYAHAQGRFTSVDPLAASASTANPQTFNRYSYVNNSPLTIIDPSGMFGICPGGGQGGQGGMPLSNYLAEGYRSEFGRPSAWSVMGSALAAGQALMAGMAAGAEAATQQPPSTISDHDVRVAGAFINVGRTQVAGRITSMTNEVTFRVPYDDRDAVFGADFFQLTLNLILPKGTEALDESEVEEGFVRTRRDSKGRKNIETVESVSGSRVMLTPKLHPDENNYFIGKGVVKFTEVNFRERSASVSFMVHYKGGGTSNTLDLLIRGNTKNRVINTTIPITIR